MRFLSNLLKRLKRPSEAQSPDLKDIGRRASEIIDRCDRCADSGREIRYEDVQDIETSLQRLDAEYGSIDPSKKKVPNDLESKLSELHDAVSDLDQSYLAHNESVRSKQRKRYSSLFDDVEGHSLDEQQRDCIVKDVHNHLVVAGAGTGKTTTIVGKVRYLLASGRYPLRSILVLSFTHKSAEEMSERLKAETGCDVHAFTFHKLGLDIIKDSTNRKDYRIADGRLRWTIEENLPELIDNDPKYKANLYKYNLRNHIGIKSDFNFKTPEEYRKFINKHPIVTFNNECVKSYGELDIANFLKDNGIAYEYERPYPVDTTAKGYAQYRPDFYLSEYDIYIEYYGIDRNRNVAPFVTGKDGKTPAETYNASIEWKRELHRTNGTKLIECYAYERSERTLLTNLSERLFGYGVDASVNFSWSTLSGIGTKDKIRIISMLTTVINNINSAGMTMEETRSLNRKKYSGDVMTENDEILDLVEPLMKRYKQALEENAELDFNDMINKSTECIKSGIYRNPYDMVIVDEYQDLSESRYNLLKALRASKDYDLFCVGDDWQSIYRFTGSKIGFTYDFESLWGHTDISRIETTYRFPNELIRISSDFIMKNPKQLRKEVRGRELDAPQIIDIEESNEKKAVVKIVDYIIDEVPTGGSVFFIGRYNSDIDIMRRDDRLERQEPKGKTFVLKDRPDLDLRFITAHKSKGLQADYVVILNNKGQGRGFPCLIIDPPINRLFLDDSDDYHLAEERRVFYVAMTRAKVQTILLTLDQDCSDFVNELRQDHGDLIQRRYVQCPECGGRMFLIKDNVNKPFYGCSNYRYNGCKFKMDIPTYSKWMRGTYGK